MVVDELPPTLAADAVALWERAGLARPWNDAAADLRRALDGPSSTVLARIDGDGTLLATAMVGHDGHRGWVYYLAVHPEHRGRGLGRRMMRCCEDWLRQRDVPKIQLMVRDDNVGAVAFYVALGYVRNDVAVMGRRLDDGR